MSSRPLLLAVAIAVAVPLTDAGPAFAGTTITVTTTLDELETNGTCSLREAVISANLDAAVDACAAGSGADTIVVPAGTYVLAILGAGEADARSGDLDITGDTTLTGPGAVVDAAGIDRVLDVHAGAVVTIDGLTVSGGYILGDVGGGVYNAGTLLVEDATITGNVGDLGDTGPASGAGIGNDGSLTLVHARVTDNAFGQIYPAGSGGGVFNRGTLTVRDSFISGNRAWEGGGGVWSSGTASIVDSTVSGNSTGCFECASDGGGVYSSGTLEAVNSTVSDNSANGGDYSPSARGGGMFSSGTTSLSNVTVAGNLVTSLCDTHCFAAPQGGGVTSSAGAVTLMSSIVADNAVRQDQSEPNGGGSVTSPSACAGSVTSSGSNLLDTLVGCGYQAVQTDLLGVDPQVGPLADNGGPTLTRSLAPGSPAIDATEQCPAIDQRGVARPQDGNGDGVARCDIGAFELNTVSPPPIEVHVDIKPGNPRNPISVRSNGVVAVAIFASETFDVTTLDRASIRFGPSAATSERSTMRDVNRDRLTDIVVQFRVSATGIRAGDEQACLVGSTFTGAPIHGCDTVTT